MSSGFIDSKKMGPVDAKGTSTKKRVLSLSFYSLVLYGLVSAWWQDTHGGPRTTRYKSRLDSQLYDSVNRVDVENIWYESTEAIPGLQRFNGSAIVSGSFR